jgi:pantothenate kinase
LEPVVTSRGIQRLAITDLASRASELAKRPERTILGIVGAPGAGKSTVTDLLARELGDAAVLVPMDGFHLANDVLVAAGARARKGAPDTFDVAGFVALLHRLRERRDKIVYAPVFRRDLEEPIGSAIAVPRETSLVITEGNYLLLDRGPWAEVRGLLDECWLVTLDEDVRLQRLIARHVAYGKSPVAARAWALSVDQANAAIVAGTASRADLIIEHNE